MLLQKSMRIKNNNKIGKKKLLRTTTKKIFHEFEIMFDSSGIFT
jgi:hypothetical protein